MCVCVYIYECVQAHLIQLGKYSPVYFLSLRNHTPFFILEHQCALVYVRVCSVSALSPAVLSEIAEVIS